MLRGKLKSSLFEIVFWSEDGKSSWSPKNRVPINLSEARAYYCKECVLTLIYELGDKKDQIASEPDSGFAKAFREAGKKV